MSLSKETKIDQITISEDGIVFYRESVLITEDGNEISKNYHRSTLIPGSDLTNTPANVTAICNVVWTADVIQAYKDSIK